MENRREFLKTVAMTAAVASTSRSVLGQNDKVRMAVIGTGTRGTMVNGFFRTHPDCEFVAACDVRKTRLDAAIKTDRRQGPGLQRLPAHPGSEGRRCRPDHDARPLARSHRGAGVRGRQRLLTSRSR